MSLSNDLISQFVKVTNDKTKTKKESIVYGTTVEYNGSIYVRLDGSDLLTPMTSTTDAKPGERVTVMIKNHTATVTGNVSSPSASSNDVNKIGTQVTEMNVALANKVDTEELDAEKARIDTLVTDNVTIKESLTASEASIDELKTSNATITEHLSATDAEISTLKTDKIDTSVANATFATIDSLDATNAKVYNLESTYGDFATVTTGKITAIDAAINELETNKLSAEDIEGKYANIDFSNIEKATMAYFYSTSGLIENVVVGEGTITGNLVGVTIKGDLIEGNTVKAEKLVIKGTDGLYYKLNTDGVTTESEQTNQNSLNGSIITANSITASKISVSDLVAFDATIGGFNITNNSIYSGVKESVGNTTRGIYLDNTGQIALGDSTSYLKYYKDQNGNYKLEISADAILLSSGSNIETIINENADETESLKARMTTAETQISQNEEQIALRVTNTELDNTLDNYYTKEQSDAAIQVSSNNITQSVSQTYATKTALNTTNSNVAKAQSTANTAKSNAATAQSAADNAQQDVDALEIRVGEAETKIDQNSEAIVLRATKTELNAAKSEAISTAAADAKTKADNALASAKSYADSQIEISANSITSTVNGVKSTANTALSTANSAQKQLYHSASGTSGTTGYVGIAQLTVTSSYMNRPILFGLSNRGQQSSNVSFCFLNTNSKDPGLMHIQRDGGMRVWAYKSDTSTWILIVQKSEAYDTIYVNDFSNNQNGVTVTWTNTHYSSLPKDNITAATVLAAKITKSTIDDLGTRVTSAETKITQNANSITAVASRTTTAETKISTLEQTAEGFEASLATTNANVTTAQNTANTAKTNAATAQSTADTAKTNAATAQTTANTARTEAANAAKTATNYLGFSSSGLVVGDMTASSLGKNVLIDSDSVDIRSGTTTLASFGANKVILGQNAANSEIDLCDGAGTIKALTSGASTSYPQYDSIEIDSQEFTTVSKAFTATVTNSYGTTSTPSIQNDAEFYMLTYSSTDGAYARMKAQCETTSSGDKHHTGVSAMALDDSSNTRLLLYNEFWDESANTWSKSNQINLYDSKTTMSKPLVLGGITHTGKNKILWSGGYYMSDTQTATLSEAISSQVNGVVLLWSYYVNGASDNSNFRPFFIPKQFVSSHAGKGISMFMTNGTLNVAASKYVYVSDTSIKGHSNNIANAAAKDSGITSSPKYFVLRYVIGV